MSGKRTSLMGVWTKETSVPGNLLVLAAPTAGGTRRVCRSRELSWTAFFTCFPCALIVAGRVGGVSGQGFGAIPRVEL